MLHREFVECSVVYFGGAERVMVFIGVFSFRCDVLQFVCKICLGARVHQE